MTTADLNYDVHVRTFEARQAMAALDSEFQRFGGTVDEQSKKLQLATRGFDDGGAAVKGFGGKLKAAEPTIGKVATGVSGLSGTLHGATGQTNALTGAAANMAGAFAGGGLLAVGVAGAITLFGLLAEKMGKASAEAKALRDEFLAAESAPRQEQAVQALLEKEQARAVELGTQGDLKKELIRLENLQLQAVVEARQQERDALKEVANAEAVLKRARKERSIFDGPEALSLGMRMKKEDLAMAQDRLKLAQEQRSLSETSLETLRDTAAEALALKKHNDKLANALEDKTEPAFKKVKKQVEDIGKVMKTKMSLRNLLGTDEGLAKQRRESLEQLQRDQDKLAEMARKRRADDMNDAFRHHKEEQDIKAAQLADLEKLMAENAKKRKERRDREHEEEMAQMQERLAMAQSFAASGVSTVNQVMQAVITGQAKSIDALLAAQLTSLGQQVQGIGIKYLFEGMGMNAIAPGTGVAAMGVGAGALATGTAMAGGGMAWSHIAAGGRVGQALSGGGGGGGIGTVSRAGPGVAPTSAEQGQTVTIMNFNGNTYNRNDSARGVAYMARRAREDLLEPAR